MYKDKRALVETLRKYHRHILGPLFTEAADTIEELLDIVKEKDKQNWILSSERLPEESDGIVLVCFPDISPYNLKEPFVNAKHNQRVQTGHYSQFSKKNKIESLQTKRVLRICKPDSKKGANNEL